MTTAARRRAGGRVARAGAERWRRSAGEARARAAAARRLMRDFRRLTQEPPQGVSGAPMEDNIMKWNAVIFGPEDTPWDGGTFKLTIDFTEEYPNKAPKVKFVSKMFHPNIYADGAICLDILQNQWSPIYDIAAILTSIQSLLCDPNPNSPANSEAAKLYEENRREYNRRVKEIVEQSWLAEKEIGYQTALREYKAAVRGTELREQWAEEGAWAKAQPPMGYADILDESKTHRRRQRQLMTRWNALKPLAQAAKKMLAAEARLAEWIKEHKPDAELPETFEDGSAADYVTGFGLEKEEMPWDAAAEEVVTPQEQQEVMDEGGPREVLDEWAQVDADYCEAKARHWRAEELVRYLDALKDQSWWVKDYGTYWEWFHMHGRCVEKREGDYIYSVCPFERVAQRHYKADLNVRGAEMYLGRFDKWVGNGYTKQHYTGGFDHGCKGGTKREVMVSISCSDENELLWVKESSECMYEAAMTTPAACTPAVVNERRDRLKALGWDGKE